MFTLKTKISRDFLENEVDDEIKENKICTEIILKMLNKSPSRRILVNDLENFMKDNENFKLIRGDEFNKTIAIIEKQQQQVFLHQSQSSHFKNPLNEELIYFKRILAQIYCDLIQFEDALEIYSEFDSFFTANKDLENKAKNLVVISHCLENFGSNSFEECKNLRLQAYKLFIYLHNCSNSTEKSCELLKAALDISMTPKEKISIYKKFANLFRLKII